VIRTLADDATRDIWNGVNSQAARHIPRELWPIVRRKLDQIDTVTRLDDLKARPEISCTRLRVTSDVSTRCA
jgi:toxin HigB-1